MFKMDLQMFAGGHSVTVVTGSNVTSATASSSSDVAKDTEVTMTIVCANGYEPVCKVIDGGVTCDPATGKFTMGEANVKILVEAKSSTAYRVLETCMVDINGSRTKLVRNVVIHYAPNGAIRDAVTEPTTISDAGKIAALLEAGMIEKI